MLLTIVEVGRPISSGAMQSRDTDRWPARMENTRDGSSDARLPSLGRGGAALFCSLHTLDYRTMRHVETSKFFFLTRPRRLAKGYIASALGFFSFCAFLIKLVREDISGLLAPGRFRTSHRRVEG